MGREGLWAALLGVAAALFGGLNVFQFLFFRSTRRRYEAEAAGAEIETRQRRTDHMQDQYEFVLDKLDKLQRDYYTLSEKYRDMVMEYTAEVAQKCREVEGLKRRVEELQLENSALRAAAAGGAELPHDGPFSPMGKTFKPCTKVRPA